MALGIADLAEQAVEQAVGYGVGGLFETALEPLTQAERNKLWAELRTMPLDAQTAALLVRLGRWTLGQAQDEAGQTGIDGGRTEALVEATLAPPSTGELLELVRRGRLDGSQLDTALRRGGMDERYSGAYSDLVRVHLSPSDAAMARQQGFIGDEALHEIAGRGGIVPADADLLYELAGLPPGLGQAIELLRRGVIDEQRFAQYVREGHLKTKYTEDVLALRWQPLSASVAAEALVRERIGQAEAVKIAAENGIREDDFLLWSHMLGRPIAQGQALTVVNRGLKGHPNGAEARAYFREVVARSDIRTEYADDLFELRIKYPPLFQVQRALANNTITPELAADTLRKEGYSEEWVKAVTESGKAGNREKHKDLSASIIEALYLAGLETHDEAQTALEHLGYDQAEADDYLRLWLARRIVAELTHGLGMVRSRYTGWKIDRPTAQHEVGALTDDPQVWERLAPLWDAEREANAPGLTHAQIGQAMHYGRFTPDEAVQRWQEQGYTRDDAVTLAWIVAHGDPFAAPAA